MDFKRITLLAGHYGSGKTNIAVNLAFRLNDAIRSGNSPWSRCVIADIDIVNPYFRTRDSAADLEAEGIQLISSAFASSNVDLPALPQEIYSITDDRTLGAVIDVGGDDRGALALGRWRDAILNEDNYEMLFVANRFRPLTRTAADALEVMYEIETACRMKFTGLVNNSNLGNETVPEHILSSADFIRDLSDRSGLPVKMTSVRSDLMPALDGRIDNLFPLHLQKKIC